jgi:hypothetical protein
MPVRAICLRSLPVSVLLFFCCCRLQTKSLRTLGLVVLVLLTLVSGHKELKTNEDESEHEGSARGGRDELRCGGCAGSSSCLKFRLAHCRGLSL